MIRNSPRFAYERSIPRPQLPRISLPETVWKIRVGREAVLRGPPRGGAGASIGRFLKPKTHVRSPSEHFPDSFSRDGLKNRNGPRSGSPRAAQRSRKHSTDRCSAPPTRGPQTRAEVGAGLLDRGTLRHGRRLRGTGRGSHERPPSGVSSSMGTIRTTTLRAYDEQEMSGILQRIG
jgi:hypothetical protein